MLSRSCLNFAESMVMAASLSGEEGGNDCGILKVGRPSEKIMAENCLVGSQAGTGKTVLPTHHFPSIFGGTLDRAKPGILHMPLLLPVIFLPATIYFGRNRRPYCCIQVLGG